MLINTDVHVQVVGLAVGTGCGKHDHGLYAHPEREGERESCMISQFKPHFRPGLRINDIPTHVWGLQGALVFWIREKVAWIKLLRLTMGREHPFYCPPPLLSGHPQLHSSAEHQCGEFWNKQHS